MTNLLGSLETARQSLNAQRRGLMVTGPMLQMLTHQTMPVNKSKLPSMLEVTHSLDLMLQR